MTLMSVGLRHFKAPTGGASATRNTALV